MEYIITPNIIKFSELEENKKFTPTNYKKIPINNQNIKLVRDLLIDYVIGKDVGSDYYLSFDSGYNFMRTKAAQNYSYIPTINTYPQAQPIFPKTFENYLNYYAKKDVEFNLNKGDILIVKDSNVGEVIFINEDLNNYIISGGLVKLVFDEKLKYYIFAMMKSNFFKEQLYLLTPKGSTLKHAKTLWLDLKIPFPNQNENKIIEYITLLVKAIINREKEIQYKYNQIMNIIDCEVKNNQKDNSFNFNFPKFSDINVKKRLDASIYSEYCKNEEFLIKNYKHGFKNIENWDFEIGRGQNLQFSAIGDSLYSDVEKKGFNKLILPKNISIYGTVLKNEYIGNRNNLKTLNKGDIVFGAEGFEKGRSLIIFDKDEGIVTNIHGIVLTHKKNDLSESIFIKCFLDYLRKIGLIDIFATGGNGGSIAIPYLKQLPFPIFPKYKQNEIKEHYYNEYYFENDLNLSNFSQLDKLMIKKAGIYQLDLQKNCLIAELDKLRNLIINDDDLIPENEFFNFLSNFIKI